MQFERYGKVNHLAERKFKNMPGEDGKQKIVYSGIGKVVVTESTPSIMTSNNSMLHQYILCAENEDDVPLDTTWQNQLNGVD